VRCPFCAHLEDRVVDSRTGKNGEIIRRRRECLKCQRRFTTYERVEEILPTVVKKDGRREPFDRLKILSGIHRACQKRPVSSVDIESVVQEIENELLELGEKEIPSSWIGQRVMARLQSLDDVAYVRFASVYRQFKDISEFMSELKGLLNGKAPSSGPDREGSGPRG
jgi:transcriptional repressor NrdR